MVNLEALNNQSNFAFNTTTLNDTTIIPAEVVTIANNESSGYLGLTIMTILWLWLVYTLLREDGFFRMDFVKGGVVASGIVSVIGLIMIVSELITNYQHVVWYVTLFLIFLISSYFLKKKGL